MIKIKEYKVAKRGIRGALISLPKVFMDDNDVKPGDTLAFYRDNLPDGRDALIIVPKSNGSGAKYQEPTEKLMSVNS